MSRWLRRWGEAIHSARKFAHCRNTVASEPIARGCSGSSLKLRVDSSWLSAAVDAEAVSAEAADCAIEMAFIGVVSSVLLALVCSGQAYQSVIRLKNSSLYINSTQPDPRSAEELAPVLFSLGREAGMAERADYASAYTSNETMMMIDGVNPLESRATVEANNSRVLLGAVASPYNYSALQLMLSENNTLELDGADLQLNRSTIRLVKNNWFEVVNGSRLGLDMSRLNMTDYFTWLVNGSSVDTNTSILAIKNALTYWQGANITVLNSTMNITSESPEPPPRYEGLSPILWVSDSSVYPTGTSWNVKDLPVVQFENSTVGLTTSTLHFTNATVHFVGSLLDLNRSEIIAENSKIYLYSNTFTSDNVTSVSALEGSPGGNGTGSDLTGSPLGTVDTALENENLDIFLT